MGFTQAILAFALRAALAAARAVQFGHHGRIVEPT